jgi:hypothetical protein
MPCLVELTPQRFLLFPLERDRIPRRGYPILRNHCKDVSPNTRARSSGYERDSELDSTCDVCF